MKILTVRQPWAALLINGRKRVETRSWGTKHRGIMGIHAGQAIDIYGPWWMFPNRALLPRGAVIGTVQLVDCRPMTKADEDAALCDWRPGLFAWVVENGAVFTESVPMKGRLGLWQAEA